jgi:hypothetical protein
MSVQFQFQEAIENLVMDHELIEEYIADNHTYTVYLLDQRIQIMYFHEVDEEPVTVEILWHSTRNMPVINYMGHDYFVAINQDVVTLNDILAYIGLDNCIIKSDQNSPRNDDDIKNLLNVGIIDFGVYNGVQLEIFKNNEVFNSNIMPPLIDFEAGMG